MTKALLTNALASVEDLLNTSWRASSTSDDNASLTEACLDENYGTPPTLDEHIKERLDKARCTSQDLNPGPVEALKVNGIL